MIQIKKILQLFEILIFIIFALLFIVFSFVIFTIIGIGFLSFLGFEYDSLKSVLIFFIIYFCIGRPVDIICTSLLDFVRYVKKVPHISYTFLEIFLDISITFILVNTLDVFMSSITIPFYTEILFAILYYLFSECMNSISNRHT